VSKVWVAVRVMKWTGLGLFLLVLAFAPWGWTGVTAVLAVIAAWWVRKRLARPPGRHAAERFSGLEVKAGERVHFIGPMPEVHYVHALPRGRHAA
jgi:hypothetical protein